MQERRGKELFSNIKMKEKKYKRRKICKIKKIQERQEGGYENQRGRSTTVRG